MYMQGEEKHEEKDDEPGHQKGCEEPRRGKTSEESQENHLSGIYLGNLREGGQGMRFRTNVAETTRSLTEWYFGKAFVASCIRETEKSGLKEKRFWQDGTGYLTVIL